MSRIVCRIFLLRWNYRVAGLYWVGSIGHSMLVLVPGAILSKQCAIMPVVITH